MIEQRVTLRYGSQQIPAIVQAVQGDTGRDVIFELADYEIPAGATANYYIDKPDDTAIYNSAEVVSSTEIRAHLTEQALAAPGRNNGQVRILSDGEVITSFDFVLEVEAFRGIMRLQSETEINIFDQAIEDAVNTATEEAVAEIQAQTPVVTGMQNSIAPTYSSSSTYAVGDYVMYNAQLYRCITAITTAEAWTAAHWTQVPLADDVNKLQYSFDLIHVKNVIPTSVGTVSRVGFIIDSNGIIGTNGNSIVIPVIAGYNYDVITSSVYNSNYALLKNSILVNGQAPAYATGYTGRVMLATNVKATFSVPDDANYIILRCDDDAGQNALTLTEYINLETIGKQITESKEFDIDGYYRNNSFINSNNKWEYGGGVSKTVLIPTIPGQKLTLKTTYQWGSVYALLKDSSIVNGKAPNFCTGYEQRYSFSQNVLISLDIPQDCMFLAVRADNGVQSSAFKITTETPVINLANATREQSKKINLGTNIVYVAASDSTDNDKSCADFVCTGVNDEITIQNAINSVNGIMSGTSVVLMSGNYYVDSFPNTNYDGHVAIMLPSKPGIDSIGTDIYALQIKGAVYNAENVVIRVTQAAYDAMNTDDNYSVFAAEKDWYYNHYSFHDLRVYVPSAQKKIVCFDGRRMGSMECRRLKAIALDHATWDTPVEDIVLPNFNSIGVAGACWDSNSWNYIWESIYCIGFGQGFAVGGEHLLAIKCVAVYGRYGFTFHANMDEAKVQQGQTPSHPDTLIDCSDEANANFWLFGGGNTRRPVINCYNLSIEHWPNWFSIEGGGNYATEEEPGQFSGHISYAISGGDVYTKWWADDGSGKNFDTVNLNQSKATTSAIRETYAPNIGQIIYDETLNKILVCTNPATKEWRDANGNIIT